MTLPKARRKRERVEKIQVYLTRSVESPDKLLLDVWGACQEYDRPQAVFRDILIKGLRGMAEEGTLPSHVASRVPAIAALIRPEHARAARSVTAAASRGNGSEPGRPEDDATTQGATGARTPEPAPERASSIPAAPSPVAPKRPEEESTAGLMNLMGRRRPRNLAVEGESSP